MLNWNRKLQPRRAAAARTRLSLEALEDRAVPAALDPGLAGDAARFGPAQTTVYVESNNPEPGQNAVLAFTRRADGGLRQVGTFSTHGTGQLNLPKVVGPDDSSQEVVATPDGRSLYAVNQGSNTVAGFRIRRDGGLDFLGTVPTGRVTVELGMTANVPSRSMVKPVMVGATVPGLAGGVPPGPAAVASPRLET